MTKVGVTAGRTGSVRKTNLTNRETRIVVTKSSEVTVESLGEKALPRGLVGKISPRVSEESCKRRNLKTSRKKWLLKKTNEFINEQITDREGR